MLVRGFSSASFPSVRIHEGEAAAELELEVPRFRVADLHIEKNAMEGTITITGKRPAAAAPRAPFSPDVSPLLSDFESEFRYFFSRAVNSATATPAEFVKTLHFSPKHYNVEAATWALDHGILTLTVPRAAPPVPVAIASDKPAATSTALTVVKTTPQDFALIAAAPWPPAVQKTQAPDGAVVYTVPLPAAVTTDHVALQFDEQAQTALLTVSCGFESSGAHRTQSQSVRFTTTLAAPAGTRADHVTADLKNGVLTVRFVGSVASH